MKEAWGGQARRDRRRVAALDAILDHPIKVLDDGFIRVVDYMGDDLSVVEAARVSYGAGTTRVQDDRALLRYLMRHRHTTPFEMCEIKLHVRAPMDTWRQWIRHRTASVNEYSTRYSMAIDSMQRTDPEAWRSQSKSNRQGSGQRIAVDLGRELTEQEQELHRDVRRVYEERLQRGVAREQARKDLPLSTYTEAYWKIDLHNLLHFLELRLASAAQEEIREYARALADCVVSAWCPITWEAFCDYRLNAVTFSSIELRLLAAMVARQHAELEQLEMAAELLVNRDGALVPTRELREFDEKLLRAGIPVSMRG